jgi:hypothetical protein
MNCRYFNSSGRLTEQQLRECGCKRCRQEILQERYITYLLARKQK